MYSVAPGDTFEIISRKEYGTENQSSLIAKANPGLSEPLTPGIVINLPNIPGLPKDRQTQAVASSPDETAILIKGKRFRFWDRVRITRSIDSMDTIDFGAPFDSETPEFKENFKPFSFDPIVTTVGGSPLFTGNMVSIIPVVDNNQKIISVSGYSLPGVLNDCTPPASSFPLEFNNQGLKQIATTLLSPFGLSVVFDIDQGSIFERVAIEPGQKILPFLSDLAKQRNIILSSNSDGALVFWRSIDSDSPIARFEQGRSPILSVSPSFSPQEYYSHITGIKPVSLGDSGSQFTVKNPKLEGVLRPFTFKVDDTSNPDIKTAVSSKSGRMFANVASYSIRVDTWRNPQGDLWKPNTIITLLAPDAMIYKEYEFLIRSVVFDLDGKSKAATLNLIMPGSFNGQIPDVLPWED